MGLYAIDCPICGKPFMWFSGNTGDQRCGECKKPKPETPTDLLTSRDSELLIDERCLCGRINARHCPIHQENVHLGALEELLDKPAPEAPPREIMIGNDDKILAQNFSGVRYGTYIEKSAFEKLQSELERDKSKYQEYAISLNEAAEERDKLQAALDASQAENEALRAGHESLLKLNDEFERELAERVGTLSECAETWRKRADELVTDYQTLLVHSQGWEQKCVEERTRSAKLVAAMEKYATIPKSPDVIIELAMEIMRREAHAALKEYGGE
jgi:hypothetical protein